MSERERWIVYPLLLFALGAALRDKFTQQVQTEQLHAGKISCEELVVLDPDKANRTVAKLTSSAAQPGSPKPDRYGVFRLYDSEGKELCAVSNNQLVVNQIACNNALSQSFRVADPGDPRRILAALEFGTVQAKGAGGNAQPFGILILNNNKFGRVVGFPPAPEGQPSPEAKEAKPGETPEAKVPASRQTS
jgi:hypothetical protein